MQASIVTKKMLKDEGEMLCNVEKMLRDVRKKINIFLNFLKISFRGREAFEKCQGMPRTLSNVE